MVDNAKLYTDRMDLAKYCEGEQCEMCRAESLGDYIARIKEGETPGGPCVHWSPAKIEAMRLAVESGKVLPEVPMLDMPRPVEPGLVGFNGPDASSSLLITGNSEFTQAVLLAVCSMTSSPVRLLMVDVRGHTVDMAMVFKEMTVEGVKKGMDEHGAGITADTRVVLPGLCELLAPGLSDLIGHKVEVGPVCAAEIPLYMGEDWQPLG